MPESQPRRSTRRAFIRRAAQAGAMLAAAPYVARGQSGDSSSAATAPASAPTSQPQYPQLRVAFIGVGGIGGYHLHETGDLGVSCLCYCDVDTKNYKNAAERYPNAKAYQDYREMFDKEAANIDAVMVGTPDHQHFPATVLAMQLGKHVYTQKPLTHTPWEARRLLELSRKHKVATQMGNQGHALEGWRLLYEWINSGSIGDVKEVHTWTDRPIWPQGIERPKDEAAIPSTLNWDAWLGPAPLRPYAKDAYHQFRWRGWWDFGAGALGDMACHTMDGLFFALDPGYPTTIEPLASTPITADAFPKSSIVKWVFPAKGKRPGFDAYWYDGGLRPQFPADMEFGRKMGDTGNLFIGTKASILVQGDYGESPRIFPEARMKEIGKPTQMLERSPGHVKEWVMACVGEKPLDFPKSSFAYSAPMSETILLGNIAVRVGRKLDWDGANFRFTNLTEANQYLTKEYRAGWNFDV